MDVTNGDHLGDAHRMAEARTTNGESDIRVVPVVTRDKVLRLG